MQFVKSEGTEKLVAALAAALKTALKDGEPVLLLVPGGSNILAAAAALKELPLEGLNNLSIALSDERYGDSGHPDSNYYQFQQAGLDMSTVDFVDLLTGALFEETVSAGSKAMEAAFAYAKTIIGFFGMGPDGHIAGILPHSPAAVSDETWMIGYDGGQFQRFTLTPFALSHVQVAFLGAFGAEKFGALQNLHDKMLLITEQPAQVLRHIPDVTVYNDQIGDES